MTATGGIYIYMHYTPALEYVDQWMDVGTSICTCIHIYHNWSHAGGLTSEFTVTPSFTVLGSGIVICR